VYQCGEKSPSGTRQGRRKGRKEEAIASFLAALAKAGELCVDSWRRKLEDDAGCHLDHSEITSAHPENEVSHRRQLWPVSL